MVIVYQFAPKDYSVLYSLRITNWTRIMLMVHFLGRRVSSTMRLSRLKSNDYLQDFFDRFFSANLIEVIFFKNN